MSWKLIGIYKDVTVGLVYFFLTLFWFRGLIFYGFGN